MEETEASNCFSHRDILPAVLNMASKRVHDDRNKEIDDGDDDWIGPMPSEAEAPKKRKGCLTRNYIFKQLACVN